MCSTNKIPQHLRDAHRLASYHRQAILASNRCYCFDCCRSFSPGDIREWIDDGQTAICPLCGIDSVLGDKSGVEITPEFLHEMYRCWFGQPEIQAQVDAVCRQKY